MVNDDDMYSFQFEDYCLTITPFESKQRLLYLKSRVMDSFL